MIYSIAANWPLLKHKPIEHAVLGGIYRHDDIVRQARSGHINPVGAKSRIDGISLDL